MSYRMMRYTLQVSRVSILEDFKIFCPPVWLARLPLAHWAPGKGMHGCYLGRTPLDLGDTAFGMDSFKEV